MQRKNRFYLETFPKPGQLVVVKLEELTDIGVRVNLLEYGNIEGLIMLNELTRKRFRSINQLVNIGNIEVVEVINIDPIKGLIDLSKKNLENQASEQDKILQKYHQSSRVYSIVTEVSNKSINSNEVIKSNNKHSVEGIYENFIWTLDDPFTYFQKFVDLHHHGLANTIIPAIPTDYILFNEIIPMRMKPQNHRLKAEFTLNCNTKAGIDSIIMALDEGIKKHSVSVVTDDSINTGLKIIYIKAPIYEISTETTHLEESLKNMSDCLQTIMNKIKELGGTGSITSPPHSLEQSKIETINDKDIKDTHDAENIDIDIDIDDK
jgi:translation initiation factor 2 subunit 1